MRLGFIMKRLKQCCLLISMLMMTPFAWAQQEEILVHDAEMDFVVWLLCAILIIQLILSFILLIHTVQMNRWLRVRHYLFDQQMNNKANAAHKKPASKASASDKTDQETTKQPTSDEAKEVESSEDTESQASLAYKQINEKMSDYEKQKKQSRKASSSRPRVQESSEPASRIPEYEPPQFEEASYSQPNQQESPPSDDADASRLDLAKAYIEMGEYNRAQKLLNKVLDHTSNPANQAEAQYWLDIVSEKIQQ